MAAEAKLDTPWDPLIDPPAGFSFDLPVRSFNQQLRVHRFSSSEEIQTFTHTLIKWSQQAQALWEASERERYDETALYWGSLSISNLLVQKFTKPDLDKNEYYVCLDQSDNPQGCMVLSQKRAAHPDGAYRNHVEIKLLMTDPDNIASPISDLARRVSGVGSALERIAEMVCIEKNLDGVILDPLQTAVGFYIRHEFSHLPDSCSMVKRKELFKRQKLWQL